MPRMTREDAVLVRRELRRRELRRIKDRRGSPMTGTTTTSAEHAYDFHMANALSRLEKLRQAILDHTEDTESLHWGHVGTMEEVSSQIGATLALIA